MSTKIAEEWLNACSGCEISIVDMGERLLEVLQLVDFVHIPVLMDHKYYGQTGGGEHLSIPEADVGIISGGVRNEEHLEIAEEKMAGLGLPNFGPSFKVTCENHGGDGYGAVTQWDAKAGTWSMITDYIQSDQDVLAPLVAADSEAYAKENNITPGCN